MSTEFERHVAMDQDEPDKSKASEMYSQTKRQVSENLGTISTTAILFGIVGFALGFACGQNSTRPGRYWR